MRLSRGALLNCILARPDAVEAVNEMEGFVDWLVDKVIKNRLDKMWRIRESVVGQLKVAAGQLVVAPSRSERTADLLARQEMTRGMTADRTHPPRIHTLTVPGRQGIPVDSLHRKKSLELGAMVGRKKDWRKGTRTIDGVWSQSRPTLASSSTWSADPILRESASRAATHAAV
jgi:hypothetical protein